MGKCASKNQIIQITLDKEIVKALDEVLKILNAQLNEKREKKFTRSQIIQDSLIMLFDTGAKLKISKKEKGEKNNA